MCNDVTYTRDYWRHSPDAPFYWLMRIASTYCHPETNDIDELKELIKRPEAGDWSRPFKEQHRAALLDPSQIPHPDALFYAASYDDGSDLRFLRRLWRDLYPGEPVPGGDKEFREDLRKLISGEVEHRPLPSTLLEYDDNWGKPATVEELQELGRRIWQRFYPDEPLP